MYTLLVEVVLGVPFGYEPTDELKKLLEDFRKMINFCIDYAYKSKDNIICKAEERSL